jgi:DnaJ domain
MAAFEVEATLQAQGASADEAASVAEQAQAKFEDQLLRTVTLPASASHDVNYYFLLGVTPSASVERIHRSYRRKAKAIHPDRQDLEFTREHWSRLMTLISEAHEVLTDHDRRREPPPGRPAWRLGDPLLVGRGRALRA